MVGFVWLCSITKMTIHLGFLLLLTGLTGIQSITTIREVSVKTGQSITIPCLYDSQYTNNVKYLCKGYFWNSCTYAVKTNQPNSVKYSISDDKSQRIFTVTIKDVTDEDNYWCAVEIDGGSDVKEYFHLSVTRGTPSLYVDHQEIGVYTGSKTTISCNYLNSGEMKWCRLGGSCVTRPSGSIDGTRVTISAASNVFNVTMSDLRPESSGWYWCAKGDFQMPVHVTVNGIQSITTIREVSVKAGQSITIPCLYDSQYTNNVKYLCKGYYWNSCTYAVKTNQPNSVKYSISDNRSQRIFTVTIKDVTDEDYYWCAVEIDGGVDVNEYFHVSVTRGTPSLYVDHEEIGAYDGDNITISCYDRISGEMKWCRLGGPCVSGSIDGTRVTISTAPNVFTVTMTELRPESSGWYWCAKGGFQMPVHVTVNDRPTTAEDGYPSLSKSSIIRLSLMIFFTLVTLFIWFMFKRHKRTEAESQAPAMAEEEVT